MTSNTGPTDSRYFAGQLLIAMPTMSDPRFARTVVYMCAHNEDGAMGLVLNRLVESLNFPDLLSQLEIESGPLTDEIHVHFGGPVETGRGFVLHSSDYLQDTSLQVDEQIALTATVDILRDMASGQGPRCRLLALGYAGWGPGQLDREIQENGWLTVDADESLIFDEKLTDKWERGFAKLGLDISKLSSIAGHA
jgi:putative transcriptional regulator